MESFFVCDFQVKKIWKGASVWDKTQPETYKEIRPSFFCISEKKNLSFSLRIIQNKFHRLLQRILDRIY